jgi:DNA gyrase subunit A
MPNIEKREITAELQESYLDYAMSVIVSRALPDVRDGLKPVQRRILWAMWESGRTADAKLSKSANVVGEVMGRYHPHGDSAIYDTLVRMAQDFSLRYPLVIGQGNWGSIDGDNAAAMRYTETKLSKISAELLTDLEKETVDWQPNYDGSRKEPKVLPAGIPGLLLNGAVGIAVGMATNIPPHNLGEVVDATFHLMENPKASPLDLMQFIQGPDFPTGGIIYDKKAIAESYATGRGSMTMRAVAEVEERKGSKNSPERSGRSGGFDIIISEIPYQVNKSELIIKMAELVQEKRVEGIRDIRDESDKDGLRIVIELKNDAAPQKILNQLYNHTDLQKDFHLNMLALSDGIRPQVLSIKDVLEAYIEHRKVVVRRRGEFELKRAKERAHILEGLARALSAIDRIIATIKKSEDRDDARKNLMAGFKLSEMQANAILDMRLQTLAALEQQKIENELKEKRKLIEELELLLKSPAKILKVIKEELGAVKTKYADLRRTRVVASGLKEFKEEDLIPQEETVITFSASGYIKRLPPGTFKSQKRGGKGLIGSDVADEDFLTHLLGASTHDNILFFTDRGRVFQTKVWEIPAGSRTAKGRPVQNFLEIPSDEKVNAIVAYPESTKEQTAEGARYLTMLTSRGMIKKTALLDFKNVRRTGIIAIKLKKGDLLRWVNISSGDDHVVITTAGGQSIRFKESQIRAMGRGASGVRAIRLKGADVVSSMDIVSIAMQKTEKGKAGTRLLVLMANGFGKQTPLSEYRLQSRGGSGIKTAKVTSKTGQVMSAHLVDGTEEILALSAKGQIIKTELKDVRVASRATQGVKVMTLNPGDKLIGVICL